MQRIILLLLFLGSAGFLPSLNAQIKSDTNRSNAYKGLEITSMKVNYKFEGYKASLMNFIIEKDIEYKILNENGLVFFKTYTLPEVIDITRINHSSDVRNIQSCLYNSKIESFTAEIESIEHGTHTFNNKPKEVEIRTTGETTYFGTFKKYIFEINTCKVGDIVRIKYRVIAPYRNNAYNLMCTRYFFHDQYPIKKLEFTFSHHKLLMNEITFMNNCEKEAVLKDDYLYYKWNFENLPGCIYESGAHPYRELPWFSIYLKLYELLHMDYNSFNEDFIKPWFVIAYSDLSKSQTYINEYNQGVNNPDSYGFNKVVQKFTSPNNDSLNYLRLWRFQKWIADSVEYFSDTTYYRKEKTYEISRPGKDLANQMVKDHTKDELYPPMFLRFGYNFYHTYIIDKRFGIISPNYFGTIRENNFLYAIPVTGNAFSFVHPKSDRCNYYFEELPFYYENTNTFILHSSDIASYKKNYYDSLRMTTTPICSYADNLRSVSAIVKVSLESESIHFDSRVNLSGQYSTLCRPLYLGHMADKTINPLYNVRIGDLNISGKPTTYKVLNNECIYPYKFSCSAEYDQKGISKISDDNFEIDIKFWINHVIYNSFDKENRVLDFYPDFEGSDKYTYEINFDKDIELIKCLPDIVIQNDFGLYIFKAKQISARKILLTSSFAQKSKKVIAAKISNVTEIYDAIEKAENQRLVLKVL